MKAEEEFKRDYVIKILVQEQQFEQWLKQFFYLNNELTQEYNFIYQNEFYIKLYQLFTEGFAYAENILKYLQKGNNRNKEDWYVRLLDRLSKMKSDLAGREFDYIEYRRHNACHIFQNSYEYIQEDLRIKKERRKRKLQDIKNNIESLLIEYGSDKNIDFYLNHRLQDRITKLYEELK